MSMSRAMIASAYIRQLFLPCFCERGAGTGGSTNSSSSSGSVNVAAVGSFSIVPDGTRARSIAAARYAAKFVQVAVGSGF